MKPWVVLLGCLVFAANLFFLVFWFWVGHLHAVGPYGRPVDTYDAISLQITVLGLVIAAMAIGLAIASIFGYQAIRDTTFTRTMEYVNQRLNRHPLFSDEFQGLITKMTKQANPPEPDAATEGQQDIKAEKQEL
jgi:hypothetical protein